MTAVFRGSGAAIFHAVFPSWQKAGEIIFNEEDA